MLQNPSCLSRSQGESTRRFHNSELQVPVRKLIFRRELGTDMVTLTVGTGPNERVFHVHRDLLCRKVGYFRTMFDGRFLEAQSGRATFPEDDPKTFDILMSWVYRGKLPKIHVNENKKMNWDPLRLYALGDKFSIYERMDRSLDLYVKSLNNHGMFPSVEDFEKVYLWLPVGSPLRQMFGETYAYILLHQEDFDQGINHWANILVHNPDLAFDLTQGLKSRRDHQSRNPLLNFRTCRYHMRE